MGNFPGYDSMTLQTLLIWYLREWLPTSLSLPGEFHGQRAWRATVHGVADRQTWLSNEHYHKQKSMKITNTHLQTRWLALPSTPRGLVGKWCIDSRGRKTFDYKNVIRYRKPICLKPSMISRKNVLSLFEKVKDKLGEISKEDMSSQSQEWSLQKESSWWKVRVQGEAQMLCFWWPLTSTNTTANSEMKDGSLHITAIFLDFCTAY